MYVPSQVGQIRVWKIGPAQNASWPIKLLRVPSHANVSTRINLPQLDAANYVPHLHRLPNRVLGKITVKRLRAVFNAEGYRLVIPFSVAQYVILRASIRLIGVIPKGAGAWFVGGHNLPV